jgi:hypothetical protein
MFEELKKDKSKQTLLFEEEIKAKENQIEHLKETKRKIQSPEQKPFIWDIDFSEIFGDKGGFDIVIGNPPYIRQEKIAPPNKLKAEVTLEDKREYKEKLLRSIQVHYPFIKKLDKKSDYYIYFYFHGLSLLNEKGTFCFITSNSWLDVGYGKDLQEFLLKYCHVKAIYDNEAKRSFEHADVNTIIALFGSPQILKGGNDWPALKEMTRFAMFKRPFEESVNTKNLFAIEKADSIHKAESYRVYPVKQEMLLEEGWEQPEDEEGVTESSDRVDKVLSAILGTKTPPSGKAIKKPSTLLKEKFIIGKYAGNKWGGKCLRAPDIFFTILEKGKGKLVRLGYIAEVRRGITTGCNEFFYLDEAAIKEWKIEKEFLKPIIKGPKECKYIHIKPEDLKFKIFMCHKDKKDLKGMNALNYIEWGETSKIDSEGKETGQFHERPSCKSRQRWWDLGKRRKPDYIFPCGIGDIYRVFRNEFVLADKRLYEIYSDKKELIGPLNSAVFFLFLEVNSRTGLGDGLLDLTVYEVEKALILDVSNIGKKHKEDLIEKVDGISSRIIKNIFVEYGINPARPIREQKPNPLSDRKALDDIVFDTLGLTETERNEVYWAVCELVKNRFEKARSM